MYEISLFTFLCSTFEVYFKTLLIHKSIQRRMIIMNEKEFARVRSSYNLDIIPICALKDQRKPRRTFRKMADNQTEIRNRHLLNTPILPLN
jgi:hypothetical protein